jgi:hypothetical protein
LLPIGECLELAMPPSRFARRLLANSCLGAGPSIFAMTSACPEILTDETKTRFAALAYDSLRVACRRLDFSAVWLTVT